MDKQAENLIGERGESIVVPGCPRSYKNVTVEGLFQNRLLELPDVLSPSAKGKETGLSGYLGLLMNPSHPVFAHSRRISIQTGNGSR